MENRKTLKSLFKTGAIPSERDFAALIDAFINQPDDGISTDPLGNIRIGDTSARANLVVGARSLLSGTLTTVKDAAEVTGANTKFTTELRANQEIVIGNDHYHVQSVVDDLKIILREQAVRSSNNVQGRVQMDLFAVQDEQKKTLFYISKEGLIDIKGNLHADGNISAARFFGDGSQLTNLPAPKFNENLHVTGAVDAKAFIGDGSALTNLPAVSVNDIDGLVTIHQGYSVEIPGMVSGKKSQPVLTLSDDFITEGLSEKQAIRIGEKRYEITSFGEKELTLKNPLDEEIKDAKVYTAAEKFMEMDFDGKSVLHIASTGDLHTDGSITAKSFAGDGSALTNLPAVSVNDIDGLVTIHQGYSVEIPGTVSGEEGQPVLTLSDDFITEGLSEKQIIRIGEKRYEIASFEEKTLTLKDPLDEEIKDAKVYIAAEKFMEMDFDGKSVLHIASTGDLHTNGSITAKSFAGDGSALTNIPAVSVNDIDGLVTIHQGYSVEIPGTVSGEEGQPVLTLSDDFITEGLSEKQAIRIGEKRYEIASFEEKTLTLKDPLDEEIKDAKVYTTAEKFMEMDFDGKSVLHIASTGDLYTDGSITAKSFTGDGSQLTNLPVPEFKNGLYVEGKISATGFNGDGNELENLRGPEVKGNMNTGGTIESAGFIGDGSQLTHLPIPEFKNGLHVEGKISATGFNGDGNELENLRGSEVKGNMNTSGTIEAKLFIGDGSKLSNLPTADINIKGDLHVPGTLDAKLFKGDGSALINIPGSSITGNVPITEITKLLTFNRSLSTEIHRLGGHKGSSLVFTLEPLKVFERMVFRLKNKQYRVVKVLNEKYFTITPPLDEDYILGEPMYVTGNFVNMNIEGANMFNIASSGDVHAAGVVGASGFAGDGSKLKNIPGGEITGPVVMSPGYNREIIGTVTYNVTGNIIILAGENASFKSFLEKGDKIRVGDTIYNVLEVIDDKQVKIDGKGNFSTPPQKVYVVENNFMTVNDAKNNPVFRIGNKGNVWTENGEISARTFTGDGSKLTNLSAQQINGLIPPSNVAPYIKAYADKTILNGDEQVILSWDTHSVSELRLEYLKDGAPTTLSTLNNVILLKQDIFPIFFYQNTTVTLTGYSDDKIVGQQQMMFTVIQNAGQYTKQLRHEGFPIEYVLDMSGKRFKLNKLNENNLLTLAKAAKFAGYARQEAVNGIPAYYRSDGQPWNNLRDAEIIYKVYDSDFQDKINEDVSIWAAGKSLADLLDIIRRSYDLHILNPKNLRYLAIAIKNTHKYEMKECFNLIPKYYRGHNNQTWLPQEHGIILQTVFAN